jgi:hypothetical protein
MASGVFLGTDGRDARAVTTAWNFSRKPGAPLSNESRSSLVLKAH